MFNIRTVQRKQTNSSDGESTLARHYRRSSKSSLRVQKRIDALEESKQISWKRFVIALILIADLFFHKRLKSETPNRHMVVEANELKNGSN